MKLARATTVVLALALAGLAVMLTTRDAAGQQPPGFEGLPTPPVAPNVKIPGGPSGFGVQFWPSNGQFKLRAEENNLEHEAQSLVEQYSHTEEASKRSKLKSKLAEVLNKQFDAQQSRRKKEVAEIEHQLKKVRDLLQKRSDAKDTIVEKRLDQLLSEAAGLGWTPPAGPQMPRSFTVPDVVPYRRSGLQAK